MCECDKQNKLATLFLGRKLNFPFCLQPLPSLWRCRCSAIVASLLAGAVENTQVFSVDMNTEFLSNCEDIIWIDPSDAFAADSSRVKHVLNLIEFMVVSFSSLFSFRPFAQDKPHDMAICVIHVVPPGFSYAIIICHCLWAASSLLRSASITWTNNFNFLTVECRLAEK